MKKSWKTRKPPVALPRRPSCEEASAVTRHVVMLSATGNSRCSAPFASVTSPGSQSIVSGKYWRRRGGSPAVCDSPLTAPADFSTSTSLSTTMFSTAPSAAGAANIISSITTPSPNKAARCGAAAIIIPPPATTYMSGNALARRSTTIPNAATLAKARFSKAKPALRNKNARGSNTTASAPMRTTPSPGYTSPRDAAKAKTTATIKKTGSDPNIAPSIPSLRLIATTMRPTSPTMANKPNAPSSSSPTTSEAP